MTLLATIAPFGFSFEPVRLLSAYRALGARSCQFYRNPERAPSVAEALRAADAAGLRFDSIHGLFGYDIDPSSPVAEHRRACLRTYENEGRLARDLGGPLVVVHPSAWTPGRAVLTPAEAAASDAYRRPFLAEFLKALAELGERLGVTYLIENQPYANYSGTDPIALARDVLAANSSRIRMCLDTGHANITTGDVPGCIRAAAACGVLAYFHVHDNNGLADDHRMPGDGAIDWQRVAEAIAESGVAPKAPRMLEVFYDEPRVESLAQQNLATRLRAALALDSVTA